MITIHQRQVNLTTLVVYVTPLILDYLLRFYIILPCPTGTTHSTSRSQYYNLRDRPHNRQLPDRVSHLTNCNFIVRMLFCESY